VWAKAPAGAHSDAIALLFDALCHSLVTQERVVVAAKKVWAVLVYVMFANRAMQLVNALPSSSRSGELVSRTALSTLLFDAKRSNHGAVWLGTQKRYLNDTLRRLGCAVSDANEDKDDDDSDADNDNEDNDDNDDSDDESDDEDSHMRVDDAARAHSDSVPVVGNGTHSVAGDVRVDVDGVVRELASAFGKVINVDNVRAVVMCVG
jgi:hypothetical protein